jgi:hypothetical protein
MRARWACCLVGLSAPGSGSGGSALVGVGLVDVMTTPASGVVTMMVLCASDSCAAMRTTAGS